MAMRGRQAQVAPCQSPDGPELRPVSRSAGPLQRTPEAGPGTEWGLGAWGLLQAGRGRGVGQLQRVPVLLG